MTIIEIPLKDQGPDSKLINTSCKIAKRILSLPPIPAQDLVNLRLNSSNNSSRFLAQGYLTDDG